MKYGLTPDDLKYCREKIDSQRSYLSNNHFHTSTGQVKSLLDVSFSANISERYYSQLSNKINTMSDLAKSQNLKPIFLTITLDGFFRGLLTANYKKWDRLSVTQQHEYHRHIPNNETHGLLHEKIDKRLRFTVKDCYNVLAYQWYRFSSGYAFKKLKKEGKQFIYLKAAEPHKDGVPHFHVLLWIPENYFHQFQKDFERYFPAPQNHKPITNGNEGDTYGFQTAIHNPVGYIMKYATKSFMDLRTGEDLNYLQSWYIKHKIRRITTSHSTIPQWVYQKCYAIEKDWFHLTDLNLRDNCFCEWSKEDDYFKFQEDNGRVIEYDQGEITLRYEDGPIIKRLGIKNDRPKTQPRYIESVPSTWMKKADKRYFDVTYTHDQFNKYVMRPVKINFSFDLAPCEPINYNQKFSFYGKHEVRKIVPKPQTMSDYNLLQYWQNIDLETVNPHHFAHARNEMIERGLIAGEIVSLNKMYMRNPFENESSNIHIQSMKEWKMDINYVPFGVINPWGDEHAL